MKSKKISTYLIIISVTTILALATWISADVYRALISNNVRDSLSVQVQKLPPSIQWEVIDRLSLKDYEQVEFSTPSSITTQQSN